MWTDMGQNWGGMNLEEEIDEEKEIDEGEGPATKRKRSATKKRSTKRKGPAAKRKRSATERKRSAMKKISTKISVRIPSDF
jgi:hypothetical protein